MAKNQNGLNAPGLSPWHIKVTYQTFNESGQPKGNGVFEEWWAGPKQYKRSYVSQDFTQTEYVTETGTYRTGNIDYPPLAESIMPLRLMEPIPEVDSDVVLLRRKQAFGKLSLECVVLARKMADLDAAPTALFPTYCFDSEKHMLRMSGSYGQRNSVYNGIGFFQGRYVGEDLTILEGDNHKILSAHVDTLATLPTIVVTDFAPPADAIRLDTPGEVDVEQSIMNGNIIKKVMPQYPASEKHNRVQGEVEIRAEIGEDGRIHEMTVVTAPDPGLAIAAMIAVHGWQYKPYLLNGKPVRVNTQIHVIYKLG